MYIYIYMKISSSLSLFLRVAMCNPSNHSLKNYLEFALDVEGGKRDRRQSKKYVYAQSMWGAEKYKKNNY